VSYRQLSMSYFFSGGVGNIEIQKECGTSKDYRNSKDCGNSEDCGNHVAAKNANFDFVSQGLVYDGTSQSRK
jgi:hypothetical protein